MTRRFLICILLILPAALLLVQVLYSTRWRITHDEAPLLYEAFLMRQEGAVPYRDFFDFQMPGAYLAYYTLGVLSGFNPFRLRLLDIAILALLSFFIFRLMRRYGRIPAAAAIIFFGLVYLQGGPSLSLQREYLLLVFIAAALDIAMREHVELPQRLILGGLFGVSALLKPHALIGLFPILIFDVSGLMERRRLSLFPALMTSAIPFIFGLTIPVLAATAWLALSGALAPFLKIALNYWRLYTQINGQMQVTTGAARLTNIILQTFQLGGYVLWLVPAFLGVLLYRHKKTYLLASLALTYSIYPALSGQFFPYHYLPFLFIITLLAALSISIHKPLPAISGKYIQPYASLLSLMLILSLLMPSRAFQRQLAGKSVATSTDRAAQMTAFLVKNLNPGDTVQPLDWTGGALLAMLESHARIATPYVFDFYFYHHVSNPYIQALRADFLSDLQLSKPRFVIEVTAMDKPWVSGPDTSHDFPELRSLLQIDYLVALRHKDYIIYERK